MKIPLNNWPVYPRTRRHTQLRVTAQMNLVGADPLRFVQWYDPRAP